MSIYKRHCNLCGKYYEGQGDQYCSHECANLANRGRKGYERTEEWRRNLSKRMAIPIEKRFWKFVIIKDLFSCWEWTGKTDQDGYGHTSIKGKNIKAHRVSYMLSHGEIPNGMFVLHRCDNPNCVNPAHLFVGTVQDNSNDMVRKGRQAKGIKSGVAKLKDQDIIEIRNLYNKGIKRSDIAIKYNIGWSTVDSIIKKETWKHI